MHQLIKHTESANIAAHHRYLIDGRKSKHSSDREAVMIPQAQIISKPLAHMHTGACKRGASDDQWLLGRATCQHGDASSDRHHGPVKIVCIVLGKSIVLFDIGLLRNRAE